MMPREALRAEHRAGPEEPLSRVARELLLAHAETVRLAEGLARDHHWRVHLDYLRDLQRVGREALAQLGAAVDGRAARPSGA
jgi:hypothetical protein